MHPLHEKAISKGYPDAELTVIVSLNPDNSLLAKKLNKVSRTRYPLKGIVERGIMIGRVGHLQLIEWTYVEDIV